MNVFTGFAFGMGMFALTGFAYAQDQNQAPAAEQDIGALFTQYQQVITPWIPLFTVLDSYEGDLSEADLSQMDFGEMDADVTEFQRYFYAAQEAVKEVKSHQQELDTDNPELAEDLQIGISVGIALDILHSESDEAAQQDWIDDALKIATIIAIL